MSRVCTVCSHPQRKAIDKAIIAGATNRSIANQFALSPAAVLRHKGGHLSKAVAKAEAKREQTIEEQVRGLHDRTMRLLERAEESDTIRTAAGVIREARANLELMAKLIGDLDESPKFNILIMAEWSELKTAILGAIKECPEVRGRIVAALKSLEASVAGK